MVNIINHLKCDSPGSYAGAIYDGMICAGIEDMGGKDACQGDSGNNVFQLQSANCTDLLELRWNKKARAKSLI